jgi:hypothetical protein
MSIEENKKLVRRYCEEVADQGKSGMCSEALLWKLLAEHLGKKRAPKDLTVP